MSIGRALLIGAGAYAASRVLNKKKGTEGISVAIGAGAALLSYVVSSIGDKSGGTSQDIVSNPAKLTYPKNQYKAFADAIEDAIWGNSILPQIWENDDAIAAVLLEMQNIDDVYELISAYGKRYVGMFIQEGGNLVQTVSRYLDDDLKRDVNNAYQQKSINFRWP